MPQMIWLNVKIASKGYWQSCPSRMTSFQEEQILLPGVRALSRNGSHLKSEKKIN